MVLVPPGKYHRGEGKTATIVVGTGTILDVNSPPRLTVGSISITEGNSGVATAIFVVSLPAPATKVVTAAYSTANGTALAGTDYAAVYGTATTPVPSC